MKQHRSYTPEELRYLNLLSRLYPTVRAAGTEIINLQAILNLPKGCEHFISDVHGEHEAFLHILNSCSGVIRERLDLLFADSIPKGERDQLATLIYYPEEKLEQLKPAITDIDEWYRITLHRLIALARLVSERYSRSKVRKALPEDFAYILEELLYTHGEEIDKMPFPSILGQCEPVIEYMKGWKCDISGVRNWWELPQEAKDYVKRIEDSMGVIIKWISVGPERHSIIRRG